LARAGFFQIILATGTCIRLIIKKKKSCCSRL